MRRSEDGSESGEAFAAPMCNVQQSPSSRKEMELFAAGHWFHTGYTLLVEITEPAELAGYEVDRPG